jgi:hypothetical protein
MGKAMWEGKRVRRSEDKNVKHWEDRRVKRWEVKPFYKQKKEI